MTAVVDKKQLTFDPLVNINLINPHFLVVHLSPCNDDHVLALADRVIRLREIRKLCELLPLALSRVPGFYVWSVVASNAVRSADGNENVEAARDLARFEADAVPSHAFSMMKFERFGILKKGPESINNEMGPDHGFLKP